MSRSLGGSLSMVSRPREGLAKVLRRVVEQRRSHGLERARSNAEIMISRFWDLGFSTRWHFRILAFEQTCCSTTRRSTLVRLSRGRETMLSKPTMLRLVRDIRTDHISRLAGLWAP